MDQINDPKQGDCPPGIGTADRVVLFDGVCVLCNAWVQFLLKVDTKRKFKLASMQSAEGQAILQWYGFPADDFETMLLVDGRSHFTRSTAFVRIMADLPFPWSGLSLMRIVPTPIRNWVYDRIALNRYTLFGKFDSYVMPDAAHTGRFLDGNNSA